MQKTTTEKLTKKQKKGVHLKLFIDGHLLAAGALLAPSGTARSPDQVSVSSHTFSSSSLSSFPPFSLTTNAYCSSCCCDHTLPLLVRPLHLLGLCAESLHGTSGAAPHAALPAACLVPWRVRAILLMDGLKISVTSVKVTGDSSKHQISSITTLPAHGKRGVSIVYLTACYLFTRKK